MSAKIATKISLLNASNLLERLLIEVNLTSGSEASVNFEWLERLFELLERDTSYEMDIAKISEKLNIPQTTLRRKFHNLMGKPIHEFRIELRINKAKHLLSHTPLSI